MNRLLVCLFLAFGCASSPGVWREVSTPHFVVRTDFDPQTARQAAEALELDRNLVVSAAWPSAQIPEWARTEVYVFADRIEFESHFAKAESVSVSGVPDQFFLHGTPEHWEPRAMVTQAPNSQLRYNLALRIATLLYPEAPLWFQIGVAEFVETVHPSDDGRSVILGGLNNEALYNYKRFRTVTLQQVLDWEPGPKVEESWGKGGLAWLFVHWLSNAQPQPFTRYRTELLKGTDAKAAFLLAFPGFDVAATDAELHRYSEHPGHIEIAAPLQKPEVAFKERLLTPADQHVVRARVTEASWGFSPRKLDEATLKAEVRAQVEQAIALDATNVDALAMDDWSPPPQRLTRARAAAVAHPDDPRAWEQLAWLLDKAEPGRPEQEQALRKALALAPNNPDTLTGLAWLLQGKGQWQAAMPLVMKAMKRAPDRPFVLDTYAAVMFRAGNCTNAIGAQQRAVERLTPAGRKETPQIEQRLADYRKACAQRRPKR